MLKFQNPPDIIFTKILNNAFEIAIDSIGECCPDEESFAGYLPDASRNFSRQTAIETLEELRKYNKSPGLWKLTEYHYLLIYDVLNQFCIYTSDHAKLSDEPEPIDMISSDEFEIFEIDFNELVCHYFYDTDFLLDSKTVLDVSKEAKDRRRFKKETFGLSTGMKVHPDELKITLCEKGSFVPGEPVVFGEESRVYPDFLCGDEE